MKGQIIVYLSVKLEESERQRLREKCESEERSMGATVRLLVKKYLEGTVFVP